MIKVLCTLKNFKPNLQVTEKNVTYNTAPLCQPSYFYSGHLPTLTHLHLGIKKVNNSNCPWKAPAGSGRCLGGGPARLPLSWRTAAHFPSFAAFSSHSETGRN